MLVESHGLRKIYQTARGPIAAVDGIDLAVPAGEFLAVCGRSGSGKSTLLGMLGGLCRPSAGSVRIDGVDLWSLRPGARTEARARRVGFLFQFAGLLSNLRAIDNIVLPALLAGIGYAKAYDRGRDLLAQVGLGERWDAYPGELSGGQQRRVALARALVNQPALLLADEPTNDLDEQAEQEILTLLRELHRVHNTTLIIVTHDPRFAQQADRVISLRSGKLASVATPSPAAVVESAPRVASVSSVPPVEPEPPPPALAPGELTSLGAGLGRFLVGFAGWIVLMMCALWAIDYLTAHFQQQAIAEGRAERKKSQELALQQLRADLEDVIYRPDGDYEVRVYLQNFDAHKPFYVLGPSVRIFVQLDRNWQEVSSRPVDFSERSVREVTDKEIFRFAFRADLARYDELLKGYMHVRISNVMIVSENAEPAQDIFQRTDDYYVYLKPQTVAEDAVRQRNGWKKNALVPRWIGMPAH
jgi:putative ABC transport system ATP-binding protein/macrolide transport system ATP-binding/permease protein/lipoprotein-releasing system ATP-binding protein